MEKKQNNDNNQFIEKSDHYHHLTHLYTKLLLLFFFLFTRYLVSSFSKMENFFSHHIIHQLFIGLFYIFVYLSY